MKLDFWQFSQGSVPAIVAQIAGRAWDAGEPVLVVASGEELRREIGRALWSQRPEAFLANGEATSPGAARQPVLLSADCAAANEAKLAVIADGEWRDGGGEFERTILLFGEAQVADVRAVWRRFDDREDVERSYYEQDAGKWVKRA